MRIDQDILYAPCPCGSGKKFKFCCFEKVRDELHDNPTVEEVRSVARDMFAPFSYDQGVDKVADSAALQKAMEGAKALERKDFLEAADFFHEARSMCPNMISAWVSEATALWHYGEYEKAVEVQREALARPGVRSVFGWAQLAEFEYAFGNDAAYKRCIAKATGETGGILDADAVKTCEALALGRRHSELYEYAKKHDAEQVPEIALLAGIAAANLCEWADAAHFLEFANDYSAGNENSADMENRLDEDKPQSPYPLGEWPYFDIKTYPPLPFVGKPVSERRPEHRNVVCDLAEILLVKGCIDKGDALEAIAPYDGGRASRLRKFLARTDAFREVNADYEKHHSSGGEIAMQKALVDLGYEEVELNDTAQTCRRMPDEADYREFCEATNAVLLHKVKPGSQQWDEIRKTFAFLHAKYPDHAQCWMNYASMFEQEGKPEAAESMARTIFRIHPDYIFAAAAIVKTSIRDGDLERAGEVVKSFRLPALLHPQAYIMWLDVRRQYYEAVGDDARLQNALDALDRLEAIYPESAISAPKSKRRKK